MDQHQNQNQNQSVNINLATPDPVLEQRIFGKVASAGRQLARMADVMTLLINEFEAVASTPLTQQQKEAIQSFREMCVSIQKEKAQHSADTILRQLDSLQASDAGEYMRVLNQLRLRLEQSSD